MESLSPRLGNDSPPPQSRSTILGSFLRGRPRGTSQSHINVHDTLAPQAQTSPAPALPVHRRRPGGALALVNQISTPQSIPSPQSNLTAPGGLAHMLRRRRSAGTMVPQPVASVPVPSPVNGTVAQSMPLSVLLPRPATAANISANLASNGPHRIRLVPQLDSRRSLRFEAISREVKEGDPPLRIGRFTDRSGLGLAAVNALGSNKLAFKSKVVSRAHAEIWVEGAGFFIKDTKSSSGTFLNHIRLSPANTESRPHQIKDGDILQLGVDYQGGTEDIYKSVKIRIEVGREWQSGANPFKYVCNLLPSYKN
jgi:E3 ubiquitin-protein ligase DMA1/2